MNGVIDCDEGCSEFVEVDPSGRYGRYDEILGKGATKTVYRGFDEYEGIEVAWNQVKLQDFLRNPEDLERLYCEIHLLKTLKHDNIMKFFSSWVDTQNRNINFVTEMFTSGTLRQYRQKHKRVKIRAVKHWCRQILRGLVYLHSLSPPVIHRDLKCDNIFINGNQGQVKIGDLGLAAIMRKSHAERCVGTPEFMAPEVYEEEYNELVDIYSFGMCILEMVTFDYPYSECTHAAEIYKKVISGKKPEALYKVKDQEVRGFVEKCLATVSLRLSARELLNDPFLRIDDFSYELPRQPYYDYGYNHGYEFENDYRTSEIDFFTRHDDEKYLEDVDIAIEGQRREDDGIFLRLRIIDKEGRIRNIYFPFDIENDTALSVAAEMVDVLDITDQDVTRIANMIDGEISTLVPERKKGFEIEEIPHRSDSSSLCHDCCSNSSRLVDYITPENPGVKNLQVLQCSKHGDPTVHGRFEEITYKVEPCPTEENPELSSCESNGIRYTDIWAQRDGPELTSKSNMSECGEEERTIRMENQNAVKCRTLRNHNPISALFDGNGNDIRQELRWLRAKYQMQLREVKDKQLRPDCLERKEDGELLQSLLKEENRKQPLEESPSFKQFCSNFLAEEEATKESRSPDQIFTAKSFYTGDLLPQQPLHRATSLPVDAIYF